MEILRKFQKENHYYCVAFQIQGFILLLFWNFKFLQIQIFISNIKIEILKDFQRIIMGKWPKTFAQDGFSKPQNIFFAHN